MCYLVTVSIFALTNLNDAALVNGDLVLIDGDNASEVATDLQGALQMIRGEWFADTREGIPIFEVVLVKNPDLGVIRAMYDRAIREREGVVDILALDLEYISAERRLRTTFRVKTSDDIVFVGGVGEPFIVEPKG